MRQKCLLLGGHEQVHLIIAFAVNVAQGACAWFLSIVLRRASAIVLRVYVDVLSRVHNTGTREMCTTATVPCSHTYRLTFKLRMYKGYDVIKLITIALLRLSIFERDK